MDRRMDGLMDRWIDRRRDRKVPGTETGGTGRSCSSNGRGQCGPLSLEIGQIGQDKGSCTRQSYWCIGGYPQLLIYLSKLDLQLLCK